MQKQKAEHLNVIQLKIVMIVTILVLLTDGDDYHSRTGPQIGSLTRKREQSTGDQRVLSFGIIDDEVAEFPETFRVHLSTSETGVHVRQDLGEATVIIMDNDGGMSTTLFTNAIRQFVHRPLNCSLLLTGACGANTQAHQAGNAREGGCNCTCNVYTA